MKAKTIKLTDIHLNDGTHGLPKNPRFIKDDRFRALCDSVRDNPEYMPARPIIVNEQGVILGGNMRYRACREMGMKEIPAAWVQRVEGWPVEKQRRFIILDNRGFGDDDMDVLANEWEIADLIAGGWTEDQLTGFGEDDPESDADAEPQVDRAEELNEQWQVKTGDLWLIGEHRLLCGDSTKADDVGRVMGCERADCVFTSPPYAVGIDYGKTYEDTIDNLREMLPKLARVWCDVVVDGGFAVVNFGDVLSGKKIAGSETPCEYPMALEYWPPFRAEGWTLWARRVWCKPGAAVGSSRHCIGTNRAASNYEHVWTWKRPGTPPINDQISGDWPSQAGWFDTTHENKLGVGLKDHGAGMPHTVAGRGIHWHSRTGRIVHEPFCGTGTTMVAAQNLGRKCYGMEISPAYCAVILERIKTAFPGIDIRKAD